MKTLTITECAEHLKNADKILILMHRSPDGDAVGSGYALAYALRSIGKTAQPVCSDDIPKKYSYITNGLDVQEFEPEYIVTVDLADTQLFGDKLIQYKDKVDLCIDHHPSNTDYAKYGIIDGNAGACAQIVKKVISAMNIPIDKNIANAVFTAISTDTGCFKYSNADAESYQMAAEMVACGADSFFINRLMFDTKSRSRLELERLALNSLKYYNDEQIAVIFITKEMMEKSGADDNDTEGISGIPRQIEGVKIGITIREKGENNFRISVRSAGDIDVSAICTQFGGGGHKAAAGCTIITDTLSDAERQITNAAGAVL